MPVSINGQTGVITGLAVGGLPDGVVDADSLASNSVTTAKIADNAVTNAKATGIAGGKILQVIQSTKDDGQEVTGTSYTDITGMSATITPSATTSKVLVMVDFVFNKNNYALYAQILRGSTAIGNPTSSDSAMRIYNNGSGGDSSEHSSFMYLDSPSTTSATTYKLQVRSNGASHPYVNCSYSTRTSDYLSTSTFTLMEVAA